MTLTLIRDRMETPVGPFDIVTDENGALRVLDFSDDESGFATRVQRAAPGATVTMCKAPKPIRDALAAYFGGDIAAIDELAAAAEGTSFQRKVWAALRTIPAGETWTYADLARAVGSPNGFRAVGNANGKNPVAVVVPCHRVIATGGKLGGYAGGLDRKRWLLNHEAANSGRELVLTGS